MDPLTDMADALMLASIDDGLNEGKELRMILAEMIAKFTGQLARTLGRQGMPDPFLAMVPATFGAFQMQIGYLIHRLDGRDGDDPVSEDDPLVQELMEKMTPVADMVNGLIERMQARN
jgi:hypothetical protein